MHDAAAADAEARRLLPRGTIKVYPGASHAINGEHPAEITGRTPLQRVRSVTRHLATVLGTSPHLASAANHALLGTDPDVERLRVVIGAEIYDRFRGALGADGEDRGDGELLDALTLALTGALLQTGMGLISYDDLADRLDAVMATILRGNA
jgi:hypothetical protein